MDIYITILNLVAFRSLKITHIMQAANLSYSRAKKDIDLLRRRGLVEEQGDTLGGKYLRATPEGLQLLADMRRIREKLF